MPVMHEEPVTLGVQQVRADLRARIDAALERGEHTVITRSGRNVAVLVPYAWYKGHGAPPAGSTAEEESVP